MMNNLFSVFDPASSIIMFPNWVSITSLMFLMTPMYWLVPNRGAILLGKIKLTLHQEIKTLLGSSAFPGSSLLIIGVFLFILYNNFMGLFPYIFTSTSHLAMTLSLAAPLWMSFMLFGWVNHTKYMLAHLVPQGTPAALMSFMVLIETVSNVIRPGTLAIRLAANMIAGHLLLTLLGNQTTLVSSLLLPGLLITQILLLILESAVAVIQSYVFMILLTLYSSESTTH